MRFFRNLEKSWIFLSFSLIFRYKKSIESVSKRTSKCTDFNTPFSRKSLVFDGDTCVIAFELYKSEKTKLCIFIFQIFALLKI